jgi:hypothetical protein
MDRDINPFFDQIPRPVEIQQFHRNVGIAIEKLVHSGRDVKAESKSTKPSPERARS